MDHNAWLLLLLLLFIGFCYLVVIAGTDGMQVLLGLIWIIGAASMLGSLIWTIAQGAFRSLN